MPVRSDHMVQIRTRGGLALDVRPAAPADLEDLLNFLKSVKEGDLRFRFLAAVKPSEALARLLVDVDHRDREDLVAFDSSDGSIAASAMIAPGDAQNRAEIAVLVRSDLKDRGIGWRMLEEACAYARSHGYKSAECVESSDNRRAIALEREQGFASRLHPDDARLTILTKELA